MQIFGLYSKTIMKYPAVQDLYLAGPAVEKFF